MRARGGLRRSALATLRLSLVGSRDANERGIAGTAVVRGVQGEVTTDDDGGCDTDREDDSRHEGAPGPSAVASVHWGAAKAVLSSTRTVVTPVVTPRQQPAGNTALEMAEIAPSLPSTYVGTYTSPPARKDQPSPRHTPFITSIPAPASSSETSKPAPAAVSATSNPVSASPEQSSAGARPAAGALRHIGRTASHAVGR